MLPSSTAYSELTLIKITNSKYEGKYMPPKLSARKADLIVQQSGNETLIYDLKINKAFCLNETSAIIWNLADGNRSIKEISDEVGKYFKTQISEDIVWLALEQLSEDGLLADSFEMSKKFAGLSRREVIRKIGFGSAIALPIISSIVSPKAMMAQSGIVPLGQSCVPADTCASGGSCIFTTIISPLGAPLAPAGDRCCVGMFATSAPGTQTCSGTAGTTCAGAVGICCSGSISIIPFNPIICPAGSETCQCN